MTGSHKWGIWIVLAAVFFLVMAFLGDIAVLGVLVYPVSRFALIYGAVGLIGFKAHSRAARRGEARGLPRQAAP